MFIILEINNIDQIFIAIPSLSVVIPAFNENKTIEKVFDRVYNNELVSEIILVDDCSTDGTSEIIDSFPEKILAKKILYILYKNYYLLNHYHLN